MKILFQNTTEERCGVYQYGQNLCEVMGRSRDAQIFYGHHNSFDDFKRQYDSVCPDYVLFNWSQTIGGWWAHAPFPGLCKQVLVYHDGIANFAAFNAVLFSDPTMQNHDNWHSIGRPIQEPIKRNFPPNTVLTIGVHGFLGAFTGTLVQHLPKDIPIKIRAHLPISPFVDSAGNLSASGESYCRGFLEENKQASLEVSREFMPWPVLIRWLSQNDINCYARNLDWYWGGVSSSLDAALSAGKPIAINRSNAFRHMHDCQPSICLEDRSLMQILESGMIPLLPKLELWKSDKVASEIITILKAI